MLVKPPGGAQEEIPRSSWRLGGGGPRSRRGAHVAEQQTALLVQAFASVWKSTIAFVNLRAIEQTQPSYVCKLVPFTTASSSQYVPNDDSFSFAAVVA